MVYVRYRQHDPQLGPQFEQQAQQGHRIRAARNCNRHPVTSPNPPLLANCVQQPLRQSVHEEMVQQYPVPSTQYPDFEWQRFAGYWQLGAGYCYAVPQMSGTFRWAARFLLLVMLAPAYQPLAMACMVRPDAAHCMRV